MGILVKNIYYSIKRITMYYYEKLCQKEIFTTIIVSENAIKNTKKLNEMNEKEKFEILESLKVISTYNSHFSELKEKYLEDATEAINLSNFKAFIKNQESGFYIKIAVFSYIIRLLITISQFLIIVIFTYPKYICLYEKISQNNDYYWINEDIKYKVKLIKIDLFLIFRIMIFVNDVIIFLCELFVLYYLEKRNINKILLIAIQLLKYFLFPIIIIIDHIKNDIFFKKNSESTILENVSFIFDIIKIIIN